MSNSDNTYAHNANLLRAAIRESIITALKPPSRLTLSQWANTYAYLSPENSADAGKFKAFGYQVGMLDAVTDPKIEQVTIMKSARVGYTRLLDHVVGYYIHQEPSPIIVVQPTMGDAENYSRTEIAPMIRDTPVLAAIAGDPKAKDTKQRVDNRLFPNGAQVTFVGANSPAGFRRITARIVAFDEVDGYPIGGAGDEGDQIKLGKKRSETFWNRKILLGSTPTLKHTSRIEKSFAESDQRRYYVPCSQCEHKQVLKWENLHWDKEVDEHGKTTKHLPETAYFVCEANGCIILERDKPWMIDNGEWIAEAPFTKGHAGFHIWAAYSMFPNARWGKLVEEFLSVRHEPTQLQTFVNLVLGQTWEEEGESVEAGSLIHRRENYGPDNLPDDVRVITAGIDTQDNRLEAQIIGWGAKNESWVISTEVLHGDPTQPDVWDRLEAVLRRRYTTESGQTLAIKASCIDTGGHHTERVYAFCRSRKGLNVHAIKGASATGNPIWPKRASKGGQSKSDIVFLIGTDTAKEAIHSRLRIAKPGPGYIHFSFDCDDEYFAQLTAEKVVTRHRAGRPYRVWVKMRDRNEALDMFVYALAALKSTDAKLEKLERIKATPQEAAPEPSYPPKNVPTPEIPADLKPIVETLVAQQPPKPVRQPRQPRQNTWLGGTKTGWLNNR